MDDNSVTSDTCSLAYSLQIEPLNMILNSEKLEKSDELVDAVKNTTINNAGHKLNTASASDAQVEFASNTDTVTHTSNIVTDQKILS